MIPWFNFQSALVCVYRCFRYAFLISFPLGTDQMKAFNGKAPITRNLTPVFLRCRERRAARRFGGGPTGDANPLLDVEGGRKEISLEMTSLPPQWVEAAEQARDDIKLIKEKLAQLEKAQSKRFSANPFAVLQVLCEVVYYYNLLYIIWMRYNDILQLHIDIYIYILIVDKTFHIFYSNKFLPAGWKPYPLFTVFCSTYLLGGLGWGDVNILEKWNTLRMGWGDVNILEKWNTLRMGWGDVNILEKWNTLRMGWGDVNILEKWNTLRMGWGDVNILEKWNTLRMGWGDVNILEKWNTLRMGWGDVNILE